MGYFVLKLVFFDEMYFEYWINFYCINNLEGLNNFEIVSKIIYYEIDDIFFFDLWFGGCYVCLRKNNLKYFRGLL